MSLDEFSESLWSDWRTGTGPCEGCRNRDCNGYFTPKHIDPGIVSGDPDPDIVFIGDAPPDPGPSGEDRTSKDAAESHWHKRPETVTEEAHRWQSASKILTAAGIPDTFFDHLGYTPEPGGGIHYTTGKKCADIDAPEAGNVQARDRCTEHLQAHLAALDPEVVVVFGPIPMTQIEAIYDLDRRGNITDEVPQTIYRNDVRIVPSLHWNQLPQRLPDIGIRPDPNAYWAVLAKQIDAALSQTHPFDDLSPDEFEDRFEPMSMEAFLDKFSDES